MEKLVERWLRLLEKLETPHMLYDKSVDQRLENERKHFEKDKDPVHLMRAFNEAVEFEYSIPDWVINGLDADKGLQKYRPFPKDPKINFLSMAEVMGRWGIDDQVKLARHIWNDSLGYYVISGKWMSELAQAFRKQEITTYKQNRVHLIVNGWTWVDAGEITFDRIKENLTDLVFSIEDVLEFETRHPELVKKFPSSIINTIEDCDRFIRGLRVQYENDEQIRIQKPGEPSQPYSFASFGFKRPGKTWKTFLEILQNPDHSYLIGVAHSVSAKIRARKKDYDRNLALLRELNRKWIHFISKAFDLQVPKEFKMYEKREEAGHGVYGFKFFVIDDTLENEYNRYSNDRLLLEIENFRKKKKKQSLDQVEKDKVSDLLALAYKRQLKPKKEIEAIACELIESYKGEEIEEYEVPYKTADS